MARPQRKAEDKQGPPAWIVSFSDMVTLLLAFFVLLQSFAHMQDPELFFVGQGSFRRAIAGLGIPQWLLGREDKPKLDHTRTKHPMEQGPPQRPEPRVIDADNEKIRKMFADLQNELETTASDVSEEPIRVEATPVAFAPAEAALDGEARSYLERFAFEIQQTVRAGSLRLYVIGLAADAPRASDQWAVSARRAQAVEAHLAGLLRARPAGRSWSLYSWGAGAGGDWCRKHGCLPDRTRIVIAVMKDTGAHG